MFPTVQWTTSCHRMLHPITRRCVRKRKHLMSSFSQGLASNEECNPPLDEEINVSRLNNCLRLPGIYFRLPLCTVRSESFSATPLLLQQENHVLDHILLLRRFNPSSHRVVTPTEGMYKPHSALGWPWSPALTKRTDIRTQRYHVDFSL